MPLNILDPETGTTTPVEGGVPLTQENVFQRAIGNRNFLNLLAGIGARLDPQGAGGALGNAAIGFNQAQAAAERADTQEAKRNAQQEKLLEILKQHGGFTPQGTPGVTSAKATPQGDINVSITPEVQGPVQQQGDVTTVPSTPTVSTTPSVTSVTPQNPYSTAALQKRISDVLPFF